MHQTTLTSLVLVTIAACGHSAASGSADDALGPDGAGSGSQTTDAPTTGSGLGPDAGTNPGTGTGTLVVQGTVDASPSIANTADPTSFTADFDLGVTRAGVIVSTGTVTIASAAGSVSLVFDTTAMRWHGAQAAYEGAYTLDITSGSDSVSGVVIDGPDIHTFTTPTDGATLDSTIAQSVAWSRTITADQATIRTRAINTTTIPDSGVYTLQPGSLRNKPDRVENESIEITRTQQVVPAGAAVGSTFRVSVTNSIDLLIQPVGGN